MCPPTRLLAEARRAGVERFVYVSVFQAPERRDIAYNRAHEEVVDRLRASGLDWGVVRPTGFFYALAELVDSHAEGAQCPSIGGRRGGRRSAPGEAGLEGVGVALRQGVAESEQEHAVAGQQTERSCAGARSCSCGSPHAQVTALERGMLALMHTLIGEHFSPWTEKARWALSHHQVTHRYREHVPLLGELRLRALVRSRAKVSVPLLLTPHGPVPDSFAIARYAETHGKGAALFPPEHASEIEAWNARSERALSAARALYLERVAADRAAKLELQPPFIPRAVRVMALPMVDASIRFLRRKYDVSDATQEAEQELALLLEELRRGLACSKSLYLLGARFSYADVAMAVTLQLVAPPSDALLALGPATRRSCTAPALAARFNDLVSWRDQLYARHRHSSARASPREAPGTLA